MKKTILCLFLISSPVFAQTEDLHSKYQLPQTEVLFLDNLLQKQEYTKFSQEVLKHRKNKNFYPTYLLDHQNDGHIPIYWLLSDYYAMENDAPNTHKWLYTALILTSQESYLCSDETARNTPRTFLRSFPNALHVVRTTPFHIKKAVNESVFFASNLRNRPSPVWLCKYGEVGPDEGVDITIPKESWKQRREFVLKRFARQDAQNAAK